MPPVRTNLGLALRGLASSWTERSARIELAIGALFIAAASLAGFTAGELAVLVVALLAVLAIETVNTAFEDILDLLHPARDPRVARIKDMMAGAVLLSIVAAFLTLVIVAAQHYR